MQGWSDGWGEIRFGEDPEIQIERIRIKESCANYHVLNYYHQFLHFCLSLKETKNLENPSRTAIKYSSNTIHFSPSISCSSSVMPFLHPPPLPLHQSYPIQPAMSAQQLMFSELPLETKDHLLLLLTDRPQYHFINIGSVWNR